MQHLENEVKVSVVAQTKATLSMSAVKHSQITVLGSVLWQIIRQNDMLEMVVAPWSCLNIPLLPSAVSPSVHNPPPHLVLPVTYQPLSLSTFSPLYVGYLPFTPSVMMQDLDLKC